MKSSCIAIIPARGGSTRVKRKNIVHIAGKSLLQYTVDAAKEANIFDEIMVNSEDDEILTLAQRLEVSTYRRPSHLATSEASIIDVIQEMIATLSIKKDICILLPTAPLRESEDLIEIVERFNQSNKKKAIVSITAFDPPVQLAQRITQEGELEPLFKKEYAHSTKSVGHETMYRFNECAVINTATGFLEQSNLIGNHSIPFLMPAYKSFTIDYEYQKDLIELILQNKAIQ